MTLTGESFIGRERARSTTTFRAVEAASGRTLEPPFHEANALLVDRAAELAWSAFQSYRESETQQRAQFLESIAEQIMALEEELLARVAVESSLPRARLTAERARTVNQLRLFAQELRLGGWRRVRIDPALPRRIPLARPDLRQYQVAIGPVAVFGASNFPLAFSVAGGDTAAALAAGCPVIVKGHPAHPGTSELIARAITAAANAIGMPAGVFSLLQGASHALGAALVSHPRVKAVAFTGSRSGGLALMRIASQRPEPIPVYAEMSSINPVVLLPDALVQGAETLAERFVESVTLGTGQFCTNPGLLIAMNSPALDRFVSATAAAMERVSASVMLTADIAQAYAAGVERLQQHPQVSVVGRGCDTPGLVGGRAALFAVDANTMLAHAEITEEVFGPSSVLVRCTDVSQFLKVLQHLEGQLTATLHFAQTDTDLARSVLEVLEGKAGRLIANSWPTGVEVSHAMIHGGPYPATSDGRSTSVGTLALERFLRPVCYQDFPEALLPQPLRDEIFASLPHRYDGEYRSP